MDAVVYERLEKRLGPLLLRQRLGIEADHVSQVFGRGRNFFHLENWYSVHGVLRGALRCAGLLGRGRRNAGRLVIRHNEVDVAQLPESFNDFTLLQLSDLHVDAREDYADILIERLEEISYDLCVITGDFRAKTFGPFDQTLSALARVRPHIQGRVYGVLGNHDFAEMVPALEDMEITMLLNESVAVHEDGAQIYVAGIDDPHYYETDNLERAAQDIPPHAVSLLLSHSPEVYRHAAHAGFDLMFCGHTHGGQICLPGGVPVWGNANCPRRLTWGPWRYHRLQGYTSSGSGTVVADVRFNCPPEITLHHLRRAPQEPHDPNAQ